MKTTEIPLNGKVGDRESWQYQQDRKARVYSHCSMVEVYCNDPISNACRLQLTREDWLTILPHLMEALGPLPAGVQEHEPDLKTAEISYKWQTAISNG